MANAHPPCTPSSSCTPQRCHPLPPPCSKPEKCLQRSSRRGSKPCPSAVSIMATKSKLQCADCSKFGGRTDIKKQNKIIQKYLKTKSKEAKLKAQDRRAGTKHYEALLKKNKGTPRKLDPCCQGIGHRGVLNPKGRKKCTIL